MKRLDTDWLQDVLDAIDDIDEILTGVSRAEFDNSRLHQAAVSHLILVISEASRSIPEA